MDELTFFEGLLPDPQELLQVVVRLLVALIAGAVIGYERERQGKAAGLRTHMLIAIGTTLFVVSAINSGMQDDAMSRVIQGIVTGIGFLGAGTILKIEQKRTIHGLTTAAGIWMTAATSVAIGLGQFGAAVLGVLLTWIVLRVIRRFEPDSRAQ